MNYILLNILPLLKILLGDWIFYKVTNKLDIFKLPLYARKFCLAQ